MLFNEDDLKSLQSLLTISNCLQENAIHEIIIHPSGPHGSDRVTRGQHLGKQDSPLGGIGRLDKHTREAVEQPSLVSLRVSFMRCMRTAAKAAAALALCTSVGCRGSVRAAARGAGRERWRGDGLGLRDSSRGRDRSRGLPAKVDVGSVPTANIFLNGRSRGHRIGRGRLRRLFRCNFRFVMRMVDLRSTPIGSLRVHRLFGFGRRVLEEFPVSLYELFKTWVLRQLLKLLVSACLPCCVLISSLRHGLGGR